MGSLYSGDIPSDLLVGDGESVRANSSPDGFNAADLSRRVYSQVFSSPVNGGSCMMKFYQAATLTDVYGTTSDDGSINIQLNKRTSPSTSGTNMLSSALAISGFSCHTSTFSNNTFAANDWLYVDLSSKSGTINYLTITIIVKV